MSRAGLFMCLGICITGLGCSSDEGRSSGTGGNVVTEPVDGDDGSDDDGDANSEDDGSQDGSSDDGSSGGNCEGGGPDDDVDEDGFTPAQGDCNDCSPQVNPGAYDYSGNDVDEDCSGTVATSEEDGCDTGLAIDSSDAKDAARAIGLCKFVSESDQGWGVISARFTNSRGDGDIRDPKLKGILPKFGAAEPRAGASLLALSSGVARAPGQSGFTPGCDMIDPICLLPGIDLPAGCMGKPAPAGYPKASPGCDGGLSIQNGVLDEAALEVKIRVPTNAKSMSFDTNFYTYEFPHFICSAFNDFFVVFQDPKPAETVDQNIVFDSQGGPIGVNAGLLAVCKEDDQVNDAKHFECEQGTELLAGTGFGAGEASCAQEAAASTPGIGGAATGWLHTTSIAPPGSIVTLRFAIWDTGDSTLDSTVLVDKFEWAVEEPENVETIPVVL